MTTGTLSVAVGGRDASSVLGRFQRMEHLLDGLGFQNDVVDSNIARGVDLHLNLGSTLGHEVAKLLVVDLQHFNTNGDGAGALGLDLNIGLGFKDLTDGTINDALVVLRTQHGMRLTAAGLAVRKETDVESIDRRLDQRFGALPDLLLVALRREDVVKTKAPLLSTSAETTTVLVRLCYLDDVLGHIIGRRVASRRRGGQVAIANAREVEGALLILGGHLPLCGAFLGNGLLGGDDGANSDKDAHIAR
mmetsp:Transcript_14158/g.40610  ORF Transcript_14158/g.40610 Transcript_14158/m.40610 type:complete len:248 (-) Transcript_14158:822-1565(-)